LPRDFLQKNTSGAELGRTSSAARAASPSGVVANGSNRLHRIFTLFAEQLPAAPGAARLARLAKTAKRIPEPLLADLEELILQLDDVQLVGDDCALHLIEVSHCDARYADATEFARALKTRLQRYASDPVAAKDARCSHAERVGWWRMALSRTAPLILRAADQLADIFNDERESSDGLRRTKS
jgi:hypothetical protein